MNVEFVSMWRKADGPAMLTLVAEGKTFNFELTNDRVQRLLTESSHLLTIMLNEAQKQVDKLSGPA